MIAPAMISTEGSRSAAATAGCGSASGGRSRQHERNHQTSARRRGTRTFPIRSRCARPCGSSGRRTARGRASRSVPTSGRTARWTREPDEREEGPARSSTRDDGERARSTRGERRRSGFRTWRENPCYGGGSDALKQVQCEHSRVARCRHSAVDRRKHADPLHRASWTTPGRSSCWRTLRAPASKVTKSG